jgi:hypothetical protein
MLLVLALVTNAAIAQQGQDAGPDETVVEQPEASGPDGGAEPEPANVSDPAITVSSPTPSVPPAGPSDPGLVPEAPGSPNTETPVPAPLTATSTALPPIPTPTPTPTETALPVSRAPTVPAGAPASCSALAVSTAQSNYMTGDYISWQATGLAPTTFVKHNVRQAPWRGEAADSSSAGSLGIGTATVNPQCVAGTGSGDAWLIPDRLPAGRYVVVVTGYKSSDPTSLISLASPEFNIGPRTPQQSNPGGSGRPTCFTEPNAFPPCTPTPRPN